MDLALILVVAEAVTYVKHRRNKRRLRRDHKEHAKKFRNSVVLELASIQLQTKKGEPMRRASVIEERRRLSVTREDEEREGESGGASGGVVSPIHGKGRKKAGGGDFRGY